MARERDIVCHSARRRDCLSFELNQVPSKFMPCSKVSQPCPFFVKSDSALPSNITDMDLRFFFAVASHRSAMLEYIYDTFWRSWWFRVEKRGCLWSPLVMVVTHRPLSYDLSYAMAVSSVVSCAPCCSLSQLNSSCFIFRGFFLSSSLSDDLPSSSRSLRCAVLLHCASSAEPVD